MPSLRALSLIDGNVGEISFVSRAIVCIIVCLGAFSLPLLCPRMYVVVEKMIMCRRAL